MKTKLYISIFLWLAFIILITSYSLKNEEKELNAISKTKNSVLNAQKEYYAKKLDDAEVTINDNGNNSRDRKVKDTLEMGTILIDSLFKNNEIEVNIIMPYLCKYHNSVEPQDDTDEIKQCLEKYEGNSEIIKSIDNLRRYQYSYKFLYEHFYKIDWKSCSFDRVVVMQSSDTTIAFDLIGTPNYVEVAEKTIQFINQKDNKENNWSIKFDKNSTEPIIFQINTYTKTDTTRKRYQIKPQKGKKLKTFDYEEIEIK